MGANGAGKSTLIKILSGAYAPDGGEIRVGGRAVTFPDPTAARRLGVGTVHQNPNDGVVLDMTVAENLALDRLAEPGGPVGFSHRRIERHAREVADQLGMRLSRQVLRSPVRRLGVSERQLLVLARALASRAEILILGEPTSALSADETDRLFDLVASLVRDGMTVLFVSTSWPSSTGCAGTWGCCGTARCAGSSSARATGASTGRACSPRCSTAARRRCGGPACPLAGPCFSCAGCRCSPTPRRSTWTCTTARSPCCSACSAAARPSCWSGCSAPGACRRVSGS